MEKFKFNNIKLHYECLAEYLIESMGYEESLIYIFREECRKRFGSVENYLKKIGLSKNVDKIKGVFGKD